MEKSIHFKDWQSFYDKFDTYHVNGHRVIIKKSRTLSEIEKKMIDFRKAKQPLLEEHSKVFTELKNAGGGMAKINQCIHRYSAENDGLSTCGGDEVFKPKNVRQVINYINSEKKMYKYYQHNAMFTGVFEAVLNKYVETLKNPTERDQALNLKINGRTYIFESDIWAHRPESLRWKKAYFPAWKKEQDHEVVQEAVLKMPHDVIRHKNRKAMPGEIYIA